MITKVERRIVEVILVGYPIPTTRMKMDIVRDPFSTLCVEPVSIRRESDTSAGRAKRRDVFASPWRNGCDTPTQNLVDFPLNKETADTSTGATKANGFEIGGFLSLCNKVQRW